MKNGHGRMEAGFTLIELIVVIILIGLISMTAFLLYGTSIGTTDAKTALEMIKQDIRRVYTLADGGEMANGYKVAYGIQLNRASDSPPNAYRIIRGTTSNGTTYTWTTVDPGRAVNAKTGYRWVKPSSTSGLAITYTNMSSGAPATDGGTWPGNVALLLRGSGSTVRKFTAGNSTITTTGGGHSFSVTISEMGSLSN